MARVVLCFLIKVQGGVSAQRKKNLEIKVQYTCINIHCFSFHLAETPPTLINRRLTFSTNNSFWYCRVRFGADVQRLCCCQWVRKIKLALCDMAAQRAQ